MAAQDARAIDATGDEVARLYAEYGTKLHRFCLGRLRSNEEAEDAVQSTFLRVYTALRQGTVPEYEAAWLYKIAHNVCLSRIESSARRARLESPQDFSLLEEELAAPAGRSDELVGLADALASMPPNLRQAILLREWQGLSYAEVAEALGVSVSAVESLIFRARRHLANALVEPAKRAAGALNIPWIFGGLRALLGALQGDAGVGVGAKFAAGAALLAIGGTGAGLGLTVGASGSPGPVVLTTKPAAHSSARLVVASTVPGTPRAELAAAASRRAGTRPQRAAGSTQAAAAVHVRAAAPQVAPTAPGGPTRRISPTPLPAGAPTTAAPTAPTPTNPRTGTTTPTLPAAPKLPAAPTLPPVTVTVAPTLPQTPTVTIPPVTVTVPTVPGVPGLPPVTTPSLTVTVPTVSIPGVTVTLP